MSPVLLPYCGQQTRGGYVRAVLVERCDADGYRGSDSAQWADLLRRHRRTMHRSYSQSRLSEGS